MPGQSTVEKVDTKSSKILVAAFVCAAAALVALISRSGLFSLSKQAVQRSVSTLDTEGIAKKMPELVSEPASVGSTRTPVYFFSHGGPTFMYEGEDGGDLGAFKTLQKIGREIVEKIKPKAVVVFSAHWQASRDTVEVNSAESTDLIYDFYGFPAYMYKEKYPNVGSPSVAQNVIDLLQKSGIKAKAVKRGLDHGVWVPFKVAFSGQSALKVPIVQVSLFATDNPHQHVALGKALAPLRDENILIIGSGMTVHNLREMGRYWGSTAPYAKKFDDMLESAISSTAGSAREDSLASLINTAEAHNSHPTKEHLLPLYIAAGAAYDEKGTRVYTNQTSSLAWGEYRFGEVPKI